MSPPTAVLVIGDVIDDIVVRPRVIPVPDSDTASEIRSAPGGSGGNQAAWLAALGVPARLVARVGAPDLTRYQQEFAAAGVDARLTSDEDAPTGTVVVLVGPDGSRSMYTDRGANRRLDGGDLGAGLLDGVGHLLVSGYALIEPPARAGVLALWREAGAAGLTVSVDPASIAILDTTGPDDFLEWVAGADVVFPNLDEGRRLAGADDPDEVVTRLLEHFPVVALKLGPAGAIVAARGAGRVRTTAGADDIVDSTGAGDAFCAGFLGAWLAGDPLDRCAAAATAAAARVLHHLGGRPLPTVPAAELQGTALPWDALRRAAGAVAAHAYAPWSRLSVGAAGLTDDGRILAACNVENASYGLTLCAECGLVSALRASGGHALVAVSVVAGDGRPLAPCGRCRQVLLDNGGPALLVDGGAGGHPSPLGDLLPGAFDATELGPRAQP